LPPDVHVALYRIAQEALNNAIKHAQAGRVAVHLRCAAPGGTVDGGRWTVDGAQAQLDSAQEGGVELTIRDDGRGFDPERVPPERLGLSIMQERAQAIGATLTVQSQPGQGTAVVVIWTEEGRTAKDD